MRLGIILLSAALLLRPLTGLAQTPPAPACPLPPDANALSTIAAMPVLDIVPTWSADPAGMLPSNQPIGLLVTFPAPFKEQPVFTVAGKLVTDPAIKYGGEPKPGSDAKPDVSASPAPGWELYGVQSWLPATDSKGGTLVIAGVSDDRVRRLQTTRLSLVVAACTGSTLQIGKANNLVSQRWPALLVAVLITVLFYLFGCVAIPRRGAGRWSRLNPLWLTLDGSGRASLSQMQILYFSVIVLFLVSYILLRTGILANLSNNVLLLLGIAGLGSVGGTIATNNTQRLSFDNWAWLKHKGWTSPSGFHVAAPQWSDLFTTNDEFDPYKFQMISFSFVIGISLLMIGVNGLANFTIPSSLLGLVGLSQATYIGGKIVAPTNFGDLDAKLNALRKAQDDFLAATADKWVPPAAPNTPERAAQLAAAEADNRAKYVAFTALVHPAYESFMSLFKTRGPAPNLQPDP